MFVLNKVALLLKRISNYSTSNIVKNKKLSKPSLPRDVDIHKRLLNREEISDM